MIRAPSHYECQEHFLGTFMDLKDFRLKFLDFVTAGREQEADRLLSAAKVFDRYVYVFHAGESSNFGGAS